MFTSLFAQRFPVVILILGVFLIVAAFFKVEDITKLQISAYPVPIYSVFVCGVILVISSIVFFVFTDTSLNLKIGSKIEDTKDGFTLRIGRADLNIHFGRIEGCDSSDPACAIVLPANEFFDDECISDKKSAMGAYIQSAFPEKTREIQALVYERLTDVLVENVEKEPGRIYKSYGIAKCVYLDRPLSSNRKIILVSVTTKRAGQGLRAEAHFLFLAIKAIHQVMVDHRLNQIYLPLLGSGHGGLRNEVALLYLVLGIAELLHSPSGHHLRSINIVIFQSAEKTKPEI